MDNLSAAIRIAVNTHEGQEDLGGDPYIFHVLRVLLKNEYSDEDQQCVAVLHDVVEHGTSLEFLKEQGFDAEVIGALDLLTRREGETYSNYIDRIIDSEDAEARYIATEIKIDDLKDNMNIDRLTNLTDKDISRLMKYMKAQCRLSES